MVCFKHKHENGKIKNSPVYSRRDFQYRVVYWGKLAYNIGRWAFNKSFWDYLYSNRLEDQDHQTNGQVS